MKHLSIVLMVALIAMPMTASAQRARGGGGGGGRGFDMHNDVPTGTARGNNGAVAHNQTTGNTAVYNKNTNTATTYNKSTNTATQYHGNTSNQYHGTTNSSTYHNSGAYNGPNSAGAYNKNTGNAAVYNKNTGNMAVYNKNTNSYSTYHYNTNGTNGYYYHGRVIVNPVYYPAWGWNRGVVWAPYGAYWGGGFWGPFAAGAATAALMGSVIYANQTYQSYTVHTGSPGATLLSNYGLRQVQCGPPGLVVIYGPNFGVICAYPNGRVAAGSYAVNTNTLTLQSQ
jgi:hypothetical protein